MVIGFGLYAVVVIVLDPATMETDDPGVGLGELGVAGFELLPPQPANPNREINKATRNIAERMNTSVCVLHRKRSAVADLRIVREISTPGRSPTYVPPGPVTRNVTPTVSIAEFGSGNAD
jgi:hypothetical protein